MIGQQWPGFPPVKRFVKGHLYLLKHENKFAPQNLLRFVKKQTHTPVLGGRPGGRVLGKPSPIYMFKRVADENNISGAGNYFFIHTPRLYYVRTVPLADLPLYVSYPNKYKEFENILRGYKGRPRSKLIRRDNPGNLPKYFRRSKALTPQ